MARVVGLGANRKVQNTGEPMPNFFFRVGLSCFKGGLWHEGVKHSNHSFYHHFSIKFHGYLAPFQPPTHLGCSQKKAEDSIQFFYEYKNSSILHTIKRHVVRLVQTPVVGGGGYIFI